MHGSAPAGLLTRALEATDPVDGMEVVRVGVDILAPIPMAEVEIRTRIVRPGKRVQVLEGEFVTGGRVAARAGALRMRTTDLALAEAPPDDVPGPDTARPASIEGAGRNGFVEAVELRYVSGASGTGRAVVWIRLTQPLVEGEEPSPVVRAVMAADMANGVAAPLSFATHVFINPDLNVHLVRPPNGEWICLDSACSALASGVGQSDSRLLDERGRFGRSVQALYVDERR